LVACAYQANGQVKDAVRLLEHVVAIRKRVLAEDHPDRLASQAMLASAYQANGQVKDAVRLLEHVIAIEKRVLAEDHPDRLASQRALVRAYEAHRRAYRLQSEALRRADEAEADLPSVKESTAESKEAVRHPTQSTGAFNHTRPSEVKGEGDSAGSKSRKWWRKFTSRK
jgi:tetratricopeptide (TPR) repeat protein